jgi:hypothetical protein
MKRSRTIITALSLFTILSNAVGTYLFYYFSRYEHMDMVPSRIYIYIYQIFSPLIFDLHTSMWGLVQPGLWDYCQLGLSGLELIVLILFLTGRRWSGWLLWSFYVITAVIGIAHLAYFTYYGVEQPAFIFPGRIWGEDIGAIARLYIMILWTLIISRIIWISISVVISRQLWRVMKFRTLQEIVNDKNLADDDHPDRPDITEEEATAAFRELRNRMEKKGLYSRPSEIFPDPIIEKDDETPSI